MAASVLNADRTVEMRVFVVRAFVGMRETLLRRRELTLRLGGHGSQIATLVEAIRSLMNQEARRTNVDFPTWMVESLDREAKLLSVTRQSVDHKGLDC